MRTLPQYLRPVIISALFGLLPLVATPRSYSKTPDDEEPHPTETFDSNLLKLRNINGNALFSVVPKIGSPLSPTSNYGGSFTYNPDDILSYCLNTGTYKRSAKLNHPSAELNALGFCGLVQIGDRGSTLTFGLNLNYFQLLSKGSQVSYFSLLPALGVRIESDAEIIIHFEISKNINARGHLERNLGSAPTDITVLNSKRMEATLGLGIGI